MKINYKKIITEDLKTIITEEQLKKLYAEAAVEKGRIEYYNPDRATITLQRKAEERVYYGSKYQNKNNTEKAIIIAKIVFEDNTHFVRMLTDDNLEKIDLKKYIKLLQYIKTKKTNGPLTKIEQEIEEICEILTQRLVEHVKKYTNNINPEIIINKINEILSFYPELLEKTNADKLTKSRKK